MNLTMKSPATSVLIVAAHPDDEVLGAGAYASYLTSRGTSVRACLLSGDVAARQHRPSVDALQEHTRQAHKILGMGEPIFGSFENIAFNNARHLDLVQFVEAAISVTGATRLITHHPGDLNDDHLHTSRACLAASRLFQRRAGLPALESIHFMEVPSSTDWTYRTGEPRFTPDAYIEIGEQHLRRKLEALACFEGVMRPYPHSRSEETIRSLATVRGSQAGVEMAEAFQTVFQILGRSRQS